MISHIGNPFLYNNGMSGLDNAQLGLLEAQVAENRILRQKLESKAQALLILSRELERARGQGADYRELTDRLQQQQQASHQNNHRRDKVSSRQFGQLREENRRLLAERDRLRGLLEDREEDAKALREELGRGRMMDERRRRREEESGRKRDRGGSEEMVRAVEELQHKYLALKQDLQSLLDEKEDLVQERDAYKCKSHRLNHAMSALLKADGYKSVDLDWVLAENRYLRETARQMEDEKALANDMGRRYKAALENIRRPAKMPTTAAEQKHGGVGADASPDEDRQTLEKISLLISKSSFPCPSHLDLGSPRSLRELCMSLLETLGDRMTQLKHQRSANKHIMQRLSQLEERMRLELKNGDLLLAPGQHLMMGYDKASVDNDEQQQKQQQQQQQQSDALLNKVRDRLSTTSSTGFAILTPQEDGCGREQEPTPDLADLQKKFEALSPPMPQQQTAAADKLYPPPPPDLIAQGVPRMLLSGDQDGELNLVVEVEDNVGKEQSDAAAAAKVDDPIVLPPHLQNLVDKAMQDIINDT